MAVAIDIGEAKDIHPKNKQDVGLLLALIAQSQVYKEAIPYSGPIYKNYKVKGDKITISFNHVNGGLQAKGDTLKGFAIAGSDKKFYWAIAKIEGNKIVVWSDAVKEPVAVRYAWANNLFVIFIVMQTFLLRLSEHIIGRASLNRIERIFKTKLLICLLKKPLLLEFFFLSH